MLKGLVKTLIFDKMAGSQKKVKIIAKILFLSVLRNLQQSVFIN